MVSVLPLTRRRLDDLLTRQTPPGGSFSLFDKAVASDGRSARAFVDRDGRCVAAGGFLAGSGGSAWAWLLLEDDIGPRLLGVIRACQKLLRESAGQWRVLKHSAPTHHEGARGVLRVLGFKETGGPSTDADGWQFIHFERGEQRRLH